MKLLVKCILAGGLLVLASSSATYADGTLYFSIDSDPSGLYTLDTTTGAATHVGISSVTGGTVGLSEGPIAGELLGSKPFGFLHIQTDGSGAAQVGPDIYEGLAYDPTSGKAYGSWINGTGFFAVDPATGAPTATLPNPPGDADVEGLAYANGSIYGLAGVFGIVGDLWKYDIAGNSWSFVGNTGIPFIETGLAYDPCTDVLYGIGSQDDLLYSIDPSTAVVNPIGPTLIGPHGGGLAFISQPCGVPDTGSSVMLLTGACFALFLIRRRIS